MNNSLMRRLDRVNNLLTRFEVFLLSLSTLILVGVIFVQVICRYVLLIPTAWAEELARYLFVWTSYLGSAYALNEGEHIEVDIVPQLAQKVSFIKNKKKFIDGLEFIANIITLFLLYLGRVSWYSEQIDADITHHAYSYVFGIFSRCFGKRADDFPRHLSITMPYYRNSSAKRAKKYPE